jgi:hypothetical protein
VLCDVVKEFATFDIRPNTENELDLWSLMWSYILDQTKQVRLL